MFTPELIKSNDINEEINEIEKIISHRPGYKTNIVFPTGTKTCVEECNIRKEIDDYLEKKTDSLQVSLKSNLDEIKNMIEIKVLPKVESA